MRQLKVNIKQGQKNIEKVNEDIRVKYLLENYSELEIIHKVKQGDRNATNALVMANIRDVILVAKQFQNKGLSMEDLICEGNIGIIETAKQFDGTGDFKAFAESFIRKSIESGIEEQKNNL